MTTLRRSASAVAVLLLGVGAAACSAASPPPPSLPPASPTPSSDTLTGLGATTTGWTKAHGGLDVGGFSRVMVQQQVYSFDEVFPPSSQVAAAALVNKQLPPDVTVVQREKGSECLKVFYASKLLGQQAPGLGDQLSVYLYSATDAYVPSRVNSAVVSDLGVTTDSPC